MWFDDSVTLIYYTLIDVMRIFAKYPVLFMAFTASIVLGIALFIIRWFYRADL